MSREPGLYLRQGSRSALGRVALYLLIVLSPLAFAFAAQAETDHPLLQEIAKGLALTAFAIVALQPVLAARYRWVERPFGQDTLYRFHRNMGMFAGVLLLAHPILYAAGGEWDLLYSFEGGWEVALGRVALLALVGIILTSVFRTSMRLDFETWRGVHNGLALSLLVLGFVHSVAAGGDLSEWPMRLVGLMLFSLGFVSQLAHFRSVHSREHATEFVVVRVTPETADVCSLELKPARPELGIDHLPGQFLFLTLHRESGPTEEHPFSIASAPSRDGHVTATIKASGDFTRSIRDTEVGDRACVRPSVASHTCCTTSRIRWSSSRAAWASHPCSACCDTCTKKAATAPCSCSTATARRRTSWRAPSWMRSRRRANPRCGWCTS
ncbi:MAG: hypothetical protein GXP55_03065 [Deltaproteobacteria bacterium]|nr:hypothetical protein [Deltaproteobacteria bacterium]